MMTGWWQDNDRRLGQDDDDDDDNDGDADGADDYADDEEDDDNRMVLWQFLPSLAY